MDGFHVVETSTQYFPDGDFYLLVPNEIFVILFLCLSCCWCRLYRYCLISSVSIAKQMNIPIQSNKSICFIWQGLWTQSSRTCWGPWKSSLSWMDSGLGLLKVSIYAYLAVMRNKHHPFMRRKHNYTIQINHALQAFSILPNEQSLIITTSTCESLLILHG